MLTRTCVRSQPESLLNEDFLPSVATGAHQLTATKPGSRAAEGRRSEPLTPALATPQRRRQWTKAPAMPGPYPRPYCYETQGLWSRRKSVSGITGRVSNYGFRVR
jgi:hypothetical protein